MRSHGRGGESGVDTHTHTCIEPCTHIKMLERNDGAEVEDKADQEDTNGHSLGRQRTAEIERLKMLK